METRTEKPTQQKKPNGPTPAQAAAAPPAQEKSTAIAPRTNFDIIKQQITLHMDEIAKALPEHLRKPDIVKRWERVIIATIARTPLLQKCSVPSLLQAIGQSAQLGLEPTGVLGSAYLVPYRNNKENRYDAQLIVGYRGLIDLARRSNQIESIEARVVYSNDKFHAHFGTDTKIEHEPAWEGVRGLVKAFYAVAKLKGGQTQIEVMTKDEVDAIRARSKSKDSGPWVTDYNEMGRKTVVRRIAKYLPLTPEMADAFAADTDLDVEHEEEQQHARGTEGLKQQIKARQATVEAETVEEQPAEAAADVSHDEETGEVQEQEPPEGPTEAIDPTAPQPK